MEISEKALDIFSKLISYNKMIFQNYNPLDEDCSYILKNYHKIYKKEIKPVLNSYRKKSETIDSEMRVSEAFFKRVANYIKLERRIQKVFEEREKHKSNNISKRIPK